MTRLLSALLASLLLVLGALFALVAAGRFWIVPVLLIAVREVAISMYRTHLARQGLADMRSRFAAARDLAAVAVDQVQRCQLCVGLHRQHAAGQGQT